MPKVAPADVEEEESKGAIFDLVSTVKGKGLESLNALGGAAAQGVNSVFLITPRTGRRKNER
jgi:hypothetical protein